MHRSTLAVPYSLLAIFVALPAAGQQATPVEAGRVYQAASRLSSPLTGIELTMPAGFAGQWDANASGLIVQSRTPVIGGIWGWSEGTVEEVATHIGELVAEMGVELQPREQPAITPQEIRGVFHALSAEGAGLLVASVRQGPNGNVFAVAAMGAPETEEELSGFVDRALESVRWTQPGAAAWRAEAEGSVLSWGGGGSDMSTGGGATATGASQSRATLALCGLGQYRYEESSETYVSIEGVSASNTSSDEHMGQWYLVADLIGTPTLFLETTDGRSFQWSVEEAQGGFLIDGYLYTPAGGC